VLKVESNGRLRFEIEGESVIASYSGGIRATYLGYRLSCEGLRLNQQTQQAYLTGGVQVSGPEVAFATREVQLDVLQGSARITGGLNGSLLRGDLAFQAGGAELHLADPAAPATAANVQAELSGNVLLSDANGSQLSMAGATYDGPSGQLHVPGRFVATVVLRPSISPENLKGPVKLAGTNLIAAFSSGGMLNSANFDGLRIALGNARLWAPTAQLDAVNANGRLSGLKLALSGDPVQGSIDNRGQPISLTAARLELELQGDQPRAFSLTGHVRVASRGLAAQTEELTLVPGPGGALAVNFPHGLRAGGNLAALTGTEVHTLDELRLGKP
jgi:hypothetical protein